MNIDELEKWIKTPDGEKWLDSQKTGLINKNNELLQALKSGNAGLSELNQRITGTEKALEIERAALRRSLITSPLEKLLKEKSVFDVLIPTLVEQLSNGKSIETNGENTLIKDADGKELSLSELVDAWATSPAGENSIDKSKIKTEVISTALDVKGGNGGTISLDKFSGRELASMDQRSFDNAIESALKEKL